MSVLNSFPVALCVASILGFLAGLGVGGGSLLVLWLTFFVGMSAGQSRILNLLFFLPSALIATAFRKKQGVFSIRKLLPAMIAGCLSAAGFSLLAKVLSLTLLRKLFGILLLCTGFREITYRKKSS